MHFLGNLSQDDSGAATRFKFGVLGLLVTVFQQLVRCITKILPLIDKISRPYYVFENKPVGY